VKRRLDIGMFIGIQRQKKGGERRKRIDLTIKYIELN
jgi:hypothetical protein